MIYNISVLEDYFYGGYKYGFVFVYSRSDF